MQIAQTETLPTDENFFVALPKGGMPYNYKKKLSMYCQLTSLVSNRQFYPLN